VKALVLHKPGCLEMEDVPIPSPKNGELLIRTKAATVCVSDINDINYNPFDIKLPMIMGHEGAGVVELVGAGVAGFSIGDEIAAHPVMSCGKCDSCKRGHAHLCDEMIHLGINTGGVFAEYFTIRADRARKKPAGVSFAAATLMEPVCVCIQAIYRAQIKNDSNVLIIGDGPFGIIVAKLLTKSEHGKLLLVGRHPYRMNFAGGAVTLNEKETENIKSEILANTDGKGIDSAILCAGTAQAVDMAIAVLRARGTLCVFSAIKQAPAVDLFKVHVKELNLCGSCNDSDHLDEAMEFLSDKSLELEKLVTHKLPFDRFREAFHLAEFGKNEAIKVSMVLGEETP
jgi:threonine dehydrogenase-like Zn-dependent dehydrogenase